MTPLCKLAPHFKSIIGLFPIMDFEAKSHLQLVRSIDEVLLSGKRKGGKAGEEFIDKYTHSGINRKQLFVQANS